MMDYQAKLFQAQDIKEIEAEKKKTREKVCNYND